MDRNANGKIVYSQLKVCLSLILVIFDLEIHLVKKFAIVVAAGSGIRMGGNIPKQFLPVNGKPLLWYTLRTFLQTYSDIQIILVLQKQHADAGNELITTLGAQKRIIIVDGGDTRFESVKNGLRLVENPAVVFVHDGVRCLVTEKLIRQCYDETILKRNAIPVVKAVDSLRMDMPGGTRVLDRNHVHIVQTPQTFLSEDILRAFDQEYDESFTDEASVAEKAGVNINLIEGEPENIKVTRPVDLHMAMFFLLNR